MEKILDIVTAYVSGRATLIVVPKLAKVKPGTRFEVRLDERTGRLTYHPLSALEGALHYHSTNAAGKSD